MNINIWWGVLVAAPWILLYHWADSNARAWRKLYYMACEVRDLETYIRQTTPPPESEGWARVQKQVEDDCEDAGGRRSDD